MSTLLADPPAAAQAPPAPVPARIAAGTPDSAGEPAVERRCERCGSAMAAAQDWCLQCGVGSPGSLAVSSQGRRANATALAALVLLIAGAAVAGYAAWGEKSSPRATPPALAHSAAAAPVAAPPAAAVPGASAPAGAAGNGTVPSLLPGTGAAGSRLPGLRSPVKPPKIPLETATPKSAPLPASTVRSPATGTGTTTSTTTQKTTSPATEGAGGSELPPAIQLDTNAASTYDPFSYPASNFGDPRLAVDGDRTTGWTAQLDPAVAPKMAEGLAIDLRGAQRVADVKLFTSTPGMTVQLYGANGATLPASFTHEAWSPLSRQMVARKKTTTIKLRDSAKAFRYVLLWISRAGEASVGTPQAPGHVSVDEFELFPAA